MITIVGIKIINKHKYKIDTDAQISFVVYKGDLSKIKIEEGRSLSLNELNSFFDNVLLPRAKQRCIYLLEAREYSEFLLRQKLSFDGYPLYVIDRAISYLRKNSFVDDERYVRAYLRTYSSKKSLSQMKRQLINNGIEESVLLCAVEELCMNGDMQDEELLIRKLLKKRHFDSETSNYTEKQKLIHYLINKGFTYDKIIHCIQISE